MDRGANLLGPRECEHAYLLNLEFSADYAAARDAVHTRMPVAHLQQQLKARGFRVAFAAGEDGRPSRISAQPDLGRQLNADSAEQLRCTRVLPLG